MRLTTLHESLIGEWAGEKRLWMSGPDGPASVSESRLRVAAVARGKFLSFTYAWSFEGAAQEGVLLLGNDNEKEAASAAWVDSWHMSGKVMACKGQVDGLGAIALLGSYEAPPGPDWGWRIAITRPRADALAVIMHNVSPEGQDDLAVQIACERVAAAR